MAILSPPLKLGLALVHEGAAAFLEILAGETG
jgi:hypothetical protein